MYKKYGIISFIIFIIFIIARVYLQSEHVKASYAQQAIERTLSELEKKKSESIALLHQLESPTTIQKNVIDKHNFTSLTLQQIYSLSKT